MLRGCDISKWQGADGVFKVLNFCPKNSDFIIIKASEGKTYTDPCLQANVDNCRVNGILIGLYHFARPENNEPEDEALSFYKTCLSTGLKIGDFLPCLDYEAKAHRYGSEWALRFINKFYLLSGVKPLLYTSQYFVRNYADLYNAGVKLWVARWSDNIGDINPWKEATIWQYASDDYDFNYFYGEKEDWISMCKSDKSNLSTVCNCTYSCKDCTCKYKCN